MRLDNGELVPAEDTDAYKNGLDRFVDSFKLNNALFNDSSLTNAVIEYGALLEPVASLTIEP